MKLTKDQIAAKIAAGAATAAARKKALAEIDSRDAKFMKEKGIHILHMAPMTVAYSVNVKDVMKVSTTVCAPGDTYCKKEGRRQVLTSVRDSQYVTLRKHRDIPARDFVEAIFTPAAIFASV